MLYRGLFDRLGDFESTARTDGRIRDETCSSHRHIEWELNFSPERDVHRNVSSPVIPGGKQNYLLRLRTSFLNSDVQLLLVRDRPAKRGFYLRFWAGMKRRDGSFDPHTIVSKTIDVRNRKTLFSLESHICYISRAELERDLLTVDGRLTLFFRIRGKRPRTGVKVCSHEVVDLVLPSVGSIREEECLAHKYVEWVVRYRCLQHYATSPVFKFGNQNYVLELCCKGDHFNSSLYRMGPSVVGSAQWCAGLKLGDSTYSHRTRSGKIDLRKSCDFWKKIPICKNIPVSVLESRHLSPDGFLTFFFRINVKPSKRGGEMCPHFIHDMSTMAIGSVVEEERVLRKKVEWTVDYNHSRCETASSVFVASEQRCLFELSSCGKDEARLRLYRMGPSAGRYIRWWVGVNRVDGSNHHFGSECGELSEEACEVWTPKTLIFWGMKKGRMRLKIDFLLSFESVPDGALQEKEAVVFKVKSEDFAMSKSILSIRVPVLEAMFLHDSLETRTGVVHIEDCEPAVFRAFLNFADSGDAKEVTADNAFSLYVISDKYFFEPLKAECLQKIESSLSCHTFIDTVCLALKYEVDDLLKNAAYFLLHNESIVNSEAWLNFCNDNPDIADDVLPKLYQSIEDCPAVPARKGTRKPKSKSSSKPRV